MSQAPTSLLDTLTGAVMAAHVHDARGATARLLAEAPPLLAEAPGSALEALLRAAEHVALGHADDATALQALMAALTPHQARHPALAQPLLRAESALALAADPGAALPPALQGAERVRAHYNAALAHTRRRHFSGCRSLMDAASAETASLPGDAAAQRALAAQMDNIASDLREYLQPGDRDAASLMLDAAHRAHAQWSACGGWLEVERADWQIAMCAAAAGDGALSLAHARAGLAACGAHGADDFEFCFAWQALALAAVAARDTVLAAEAREAMAHRLSLLTDPGDLAYGRAQLAEIDLQCQGMPA